MDLSLERLKEAVSIREQIDTLERRLSSIFGGSARSSSGQGSSAGSSSGGTGTAESPRRGPGRGRGPRRPMSAATRAKLAAAAKARWARQKGESAGATSSSSSSNSGQASSGAKSSRKRKGGITPAGRRRLAEAMRARWAARRAGSKKS